MAFYDAQAFVYQINLADEVLKAVRYHFGQRPYFLFDGFPYRSSDSFQNILIHDDIKGFISLLYHTEYNRILLAAAPCLRRLPHAWL
ncbi:hypothetical protein [Methylomagnum ishizawai]|uniref:hypothetical protein n=1 Tax=Methylomagnum ishizawai TaxID=1760988 RepID=UPI001C80EAEB|nr:hypothetical protein [Methylomagnum ishizawai]